LKKLDLNEDDLKCGTHEPMTDFNPKMIRSYRENGITPSGVHNNCSGKHAGLLITAKKNGNSLDDYYTKEHPVQQEITKIIAEICEYSHENIGIGIDGCGVPVHAMPLYKFAHGYARMSKPSTISGREGVVSRITKAMREYPEMIGGTGDFTTEIMKLFSDKLFCKLGANGFFAIGLVDKGLGIAIKMEDGQFTKSIPLVVVSVLECIGAITPEEVGMAKELPSYKSAANYTNHHGDEAIKREAVFELRQMS
jgi:L-asparaginase II